MASSGYSDIILATLALLGTTIAAIIWMVKYLAGELSKDLREHTKAATQLAEAAKEQKKASNEVLLFMKNLNGKLESATIQKVAEKSAPKRR